MIKNIYETDIKSVYYTRQMQIMFERDYFHWITYNAMVGLWKLGYLKDYRIKREKGTSTRYFLHKSNRYPMRQENLRRKI